MGKAKILIVEDEIIVASNIKLNLEQYQYEVPAMAAAGDEAIKKTLELRPDLVLMDIKIRGNMDGIDAAREIRKQMDVPIVFMTAYTDPGTFERAKQTEPAGYILKPFETRDLRSVIEMALYKHTMEQQLKQSEARYRRLFEQSAAMLADTEALYHFSLSLTTARSYTELLYEVVNNITKALPAQVTVIITVDLVKKQVTRMVTSQTPEPLAPLASFEELMDGLSGWAIHHKKPALSPKGKPDPREGPLVQKRRQANRAGAILVVPLIYRGNILGTITVANNLDGPDFSQRDVKLLTAMANQTAIALENARLFHLAQQRVAELEAVRQTALNLTSSLNLPVVLEGILQSAIKLVPGVIKAVIYLYRQQKLAFAAELVINPQDTPPSFDPPRPYGITNTVARHGEMIVISDISVHSRYADSPHLWGMAMVSLPLKISSRVVGVMNLFHPAPYNWTESELRLFQLLGDHAAIAIENARLHEQAQHTGASPAPNDIY